MFRRIIAVALVATALVALIVYSQLRPQAMFVSGLVEADEIRLGSRVGGRVKSVMVREGMTVTAGMALVDFEPYDLQQREQKAIAELAEREAELRKLTVGLRPEEIAQATSRYEQAVAELSLKREGPRPEEIAAAEDRLNAAQTEFQLAKREFDRQLKLIQDNAVSKSEFDVADGNFKVTQSNVNVRKNELRILQSGSREQEIAIAAARVEDLRLAWELAKQGFRDEEVEQATAATNAAAASLAVIRQQQSELTLYAPAEGVIDAFDLQPGDLVAPNAPVMTMLSRNHMWVRAYVPQRFLKLKVGQKLRVTVDSFPDRDFQGEVTFISDQAEFTPSNVQTPDDRAKLVYRIRVTLENAEDIRAGMTADVWLDSVDGAGSVKDP